MRLSGWLFPIWRRQRCVYETGATKRGLPRTVGHKAGAETFRRIATYCKEIGVKYLTVYAFSTENWKRSADEVAAIMGLLKRLSLIHI